MVKYICSILFFGNLFWINISHAQRSRIEIPIYSTLNSHRLVSLDTAGLLIFGRQVKDKDKLFFTRYDSTFKEKWSLEKEIYKNLPFTYHYFDPTQNNLYVLFSKYSSRFFQIIKINTNAGFTENYEFTSLNYADVIDFKATNEYAYLIINTDLEPFLLCYHFETKQTKVLPLKGKGFSEIKFTELDPKDGLLHISILSSYKAREYEIVVRSFFKDNEVQNFTLHGTDKFELLNGQLCPHIEGNNTQSVIGVYRKVNDPYAQGIFFISVDSTGKAIKEKFHSFSTLKNFFKYLDPPVELRYKDRLKKVLSKGRDWDYGYQVNLQQISMDSTHYLFKAELVLLDNLPPRPIPFFSVVAPQWVYHHAISVELDDEGALLWDACFKTEDYRTAQKIPLIKHHFTGDTLKQLFTDNEKIYKQSFVKGNSVKDIEEEDLFPLSESAKGREPLQVRIQHWFDEIYLISGTQEIKEEAEYRKVFFVEKLKY